MSDWQTSKARLVLSALLRLGWTIKRTTGSHGVLAREDGRPSYSRFTTAIGPRMLTRVARRTGLMPKDL